MRLALLVLVLLSPASLDDGSPGMLVQADAADERRATDGRTSVLLLMADDLRPVSCSLPPTEYSCCHDHNRAPAMLALCAAVGC